MESIQPFYNRTANSLCCLLTITFLLVACTSPVHRQLEQIATFVDSVPEKARLQLDSIDRGSLNREDAALYALLKTQADYKCYIPLTSDSLIRTAVDYYGDKKSYRAALATYYLGCVYSDLEDDEEAVRASLKAERLFPDTTVRYYALNLQNIGHCYLSKGMPDAALPILERYLNLLDEAEQSDILLAQTYIARAYLYKNNFAKASTAYWEIINDKNATNYSKSNALFELGKMEYSQQHYAEAEELFNQVIATDEEKEKLGHTYWFKGILAELR